MPQVPDEQFYRASLEARPFQPGGSAPPAPDPIVARFGSLRDDLRAALAEPPYWVMAAGLFVSLAIGDTVFKKISPSAGIASMIALACLAVGVPLLLAPVRRWWALQRRWPAYWADAQGQHSAALTEWQQARATTADDWSRREQDRAAWVRRLIEGDVEAMGETLADTLSDLDFPFEAACRVGVSSSTTAFVLLDLPEIEDVIPETKQSVLKSGQIKESRRTKAERAAAYAELATGIGLWCTRAAFCVAPTLAQVTLAAYTQRRQPRSGELRDDFVYELTVNRQQAAMLDPSRQDPVGLVKALQSRIDLRDNAELKAITPPSWRAELD